MRAPPATTTDLAGGVFAGCIVTALILLSLVMMQLPSRELDWAWFSIGYALIWAVLGRAYSRNSTLDLLSPFFVLPAVMYLYCVASGIYVDTNGETYMGDPISSQTRYRYYAACLAGIAGFGSGALAARRWPPGLFGSGVLESSGHARRFPVACLGFGVLIALLSPADVLSYFNPFTAAAYGDWALESRLDRSLDPGAGLRDVVSFYIPVVLLLSGSVAVVLSNRNILLRITAAALIIAYLVTNTLAGKRGVVVEAAVPMVIVFHYRVRQIRLREAIVFMLSGYLFINLMAIARVSSNPLEMFQAVADAAGTAGPKLLAVTATSELWTGMNLHRLIEGIAANETHLSYGMSIVNEAATFVPRVLYPGRPLSLGEQFADVFYPGLLESGGGMGLFLLQEGYWALGTFGVAVTMFVFGYLLEAGYRQFRAHAADMAVTLIYGFAYPALVLSSVRSGITGSIKSAALTVAPLLLVLLVLSLLDRAGFKESS